MRGRNTQQAGDVGEGFPQEVRLELNLQEVSQLVEGLKRTSVGTWKDERGCTSETVGGLHEVFLLQCCIGRWSVEITSDFLGSNGHFRNSFTLHIFTGIVTVAVRSSP